MFARLLALFAPLAFTEPSESGGAPGEAPAVEAGGGGAAPTGGEPGGEAPAGGDDAPTAADIFAPDFDPDAAVGDDVPYRNAKELREQVTAARKQYGPIAEALGGLDPAAADTIMRFAPAHQLARVVPSIAGDVAYLQAAYAGLHPEDQAAIGRVIAGARQDPQAAAQLLAQAAATLREPDGGAPAGAGAGDDDDDGVEVDDFGFEITDPNRPLTQAEFDQRMERYAQEQAQRAEIEQFKAEHLARVTNALREGGYDPDSRDPLERAKIQTIVNIMATDANVTVEQAMETVDGWKQQVIDQFVQGKLGPNGQARPQPPSGGASPTGERKLETLEEMDAAAAERARQIAASRR